MAQATDLVELRRKRKRNGTQYLELSDDLTVGVNIVGLETLIAQGKIPNPLLKMAMDLNRKSGTELEAAEILQSIQFMDTLCGAIIVDPPWCQISEAGEGAVPEGKLCLADLSDDERNCIFRLVYGGIESYETFRAERRSDIDAPNGGGVRAETNELVGAIPTGTELHSVLDRPSDLGESC
jgi:hypothetical protein